MYLTQGLHRALQRHPDKMALHHLKEGSERHWTFAQFADIWYRNMWLYAKKWFGRGQAETLRWAIMAGMLLRAVAGLAGLLPRGVPRREAYRAYRRVMKRAFDRWEESRSSS